MFALRGSVRALPLLTEALVIRGATCAGPSSRVSASICQVAPRRLYAAAPVAATSAAAAAAAAAVPAATAAEPSRDALDPFGLVVDEIDAVAERLRRSIVTDVPALGSAAEYFFRRGAEGKRLRSTVLLLLADAISATEAAEADRLTVDEAPAGEPGATVRRRQQRLTEITELIHVASLLHDDVIDGAGTRRGKAALNTVVGNKVAILAGDFLLARASVSLAALRDPEVIALISRCLEYLVAGEVMQLTASPDDALDIEHYTRKSFCKTAALIANSCRAIAILGDATPDAAEAAWEYGRSLGLAFQLVDDVLDFEGTAEELGKPAMHDLASGLATAPVLYALEEQPTLAPLVRRRFSRKGDPEQALALVRASSGIARAKREAAAHCQAARDALARLPPPQVDEARRAHAALAKLTDIVLNRKK